MINYCEIWLVKKLIWLVKIEFYCVRMSQSLFPISKIFYGIYSAFFTENKSRMTWRQQMLMLSYILLINIQGCIYFNLLKLSLHYPTASWRCADAPETYWAALCSQHAASTCCSSNLPRICFGHNALWTFSFVWLHCEIFRQLYEAVFNLWP